MISRAKPLFLSAPQAEAISENRARISRNLLPVPELRKVKDLRDFQGKQLLKNGLPSLFKISKACQVKILDKPLLFMYYRKGVKMLRGFHYGKNR